jgi:hypothetical protein
MYYSMDVIGDIYCPSFFFSQCFLSCEVEELIFLYCPFECILISGIFNLVSTSIEPTIIRFFSLFQCHLYFNFLYQLNSECAVDLLARVCFFCFYLIYRYIFRRFFIKRCFEELTNCKIFKFSISNKSFIKLFFLLSNFINFRIVKHYHKLRIVKENL